MAGCYRTCGEEMASALGAQARLRYDPQVEPAPDDTRELSPVAPYDLLGTVRWLRTGGRDPSFVLGARGFRRALTTSDGVATVEVEDMGHHLRVRAWGPGAAQACASAAELVGAHRPPWDLPSAGHRPLDDLARRYPGLRLANPGDVFEALLISIPQQLVTWREAVAGWRRLVLRAGSPAPLGLVASPTPRQVRALSLHDVVGCGIGRRRAETILRCARAAGRLQEVTQMSSADAMDRLQRVRGIGPWTAASVLGQRLGRADVVIEGDVHLPNTVAYGLVGQARSDDAGMRELLAPYAGHEMRVVMLLMAGGVSAPRRGPKVAPRWR